MTQNEISKLFASGPFLIGLASLLFATDSLIRFPAVSTFDPVFLVLFEHLLVILIFTPALLTTWRKSFIRLSMKEWIAIAFSGIGGSALATVYFTASFQYVNPSVAVLLQKLQPIMVVVIAYMFLGERPPKKFYFWSILALAAGLVLSFPDLNFDFLGDVDVRSKGIRYALGASALWACSTVAGKIVVHRIPPSVATFWRFLFGLITLIVLSSVTQQHAQWKAVLSGSTAFSLLYLSLVPGFVAMFAYYCGLAKTQASVATFVELLYPIMAVILNTLFLHTPLNSIQVLSGIALIVAVTMISMSPSAPSEKSAELSHA